MERFVEADTNDNYYVHISLRNSLINDKKILAELGLGDIKLSGTTTSSISSNSSKSYSMFSLTKEKAEEILNKFNDMSA